jgi:hypothetical protein
LEKATGKSVIAGGYSTSSVPGAFTNHQSPITNHLQPYSGLAIAEPALKQSPFYVNCGPKVRRQQRC